MRKKYFIVFTLFLVIFLSCFAQEIQFNKADSTAKSQTIFIAESAVRFDVMEVTICT